MITKSPFMEHALSEAKKAYERNEVPVGAVIVSAGEIISAEYNRMVELQDPTAHAEILAIREACKKIGNMRLTNCDLYVTLEPCQMCAKAISFARIKALYFGATDEKCTCNHYPEVYSGIYEKQSAKLLKQFFTDRRGSM